MCCFVGRFLAVASSVGLAPFDGVDQVAQPLAATAFAILVCSTESTEPKTTGLGNLTVVCVGVVALGLHTQRVVCFYRVL